MLQLARTRRPRRAGEWTEGKAATFVVTLAVSRSVTLAASRAGMSRKSAYALKRRDTGFAAAWIAALATGEEPALNSVQGAKVGEVDDPRISKAQGNNAPALTSRAADAKSRDRFFATLWNWPAESGWQPLARETTLP